ncbi:mRNA 3'-end-processing protein rna14 [Rhodotorula toruloides]
MSDPSTQTVDPRRARMQQNARATASSPATLQPQQAPAHAETSAAGIGQPEESTPAPSEPTATLADIPSTDTIAFSLPQSALSPATPQQAARPDSVTATPAAEDPSAPTAGDRSASQDMDAAIAATLAMETADRQTASNGLQSTAAAVAETIGRDEASTPTLYTAAASEGDVPGAVATPPPAAPATSAAPAEDAPHVSASTAVADPKGKGAATSSLSRVAQLTARVEKDPLDGEAQLALLQDAEQKGDLERTREVYEKFLSVFPDAAQQWIAYCNLELSHNLFERVEAIFGRCCLNSTSVDLWRFYLDYIRRVNPIDPANIDAAKTARAVIGAAFEFALSHVGHDRRAGEIWSEYIAFLREAPTRGNWEDQQKMDSLRKAFQRAVQAPVNNVEAIWQDYNAFENNLSKMTAKKFIAELSPAYMTARKTLRELRAQHDHLYTPVLPHRPSWTSAEDRDALEGWKAYLAYEETNPLEIEDQGQLAQRVAFAYRKAIANLRFYPEVWYLAAGFNLKSGRVDDARKQLRDGLTANAGSLLLAYTLADIEEGRSDFTTCYGIYDSLIEHLNSRISSLDADIEAEVASAVADMEVEHVAQIKAAQDDGREEEAESVEAREKRSQEIEELKKEIRERKAPEMETVKKAVANVWITEMRFARRSDGLRQARQVFLKAKKSPNLTWQVVEASAAMEMYWNSEPKVATNVFELGLKSFAKEPEYVLRYLDFLISQNNSNNARALFERTIAIIEPAKAKAIWDRMAQYEFQYGDYLAAQKMAQRYAETFPETPATFRFAQQHQSAGLEDAFSLDLGPSFVRQIKRDTRARSPSPQRGRHKRGLSVDRDGADGDQDSSDAKRARRGMSPSPAPSSTGGGGSGWRPHGSEDHRRHAREAAPALNRAQPYMLDPRGNDVAILPDAVVFFLSLLPPAASFNGPHLNPASIMDIIGTTILPGSAPGPGLPGERLGIPPRPKPQRPAYGGGGGGGVGGGYGGGRRY